MSDQSVLLAPHNKIEFVDPRLTWPAYGSVKMDGNRLFIQKGELLTRSFKPQSNTRLTQHLAQIAEYSYNHDICFDGELYAHGVIFSDLQTTLRTYESSISTTINFHVFDCYMPGSEDEWYVRRVAWYNSILASNKFANVVPVEQVPLESPDEGAEFYKWAVDNGYEGIMLRSLTGRYKHGRATANENIVYKFKQFATVDGRVVEVIQAQRMKPEVRFGERSRNRLGYMERSHKQDDYEPYSAVGSLRVVTEENVSVCIGFGVGYPQSVRETMWEQRHELVGQWCEFEFINVGIKNKPRSGRLIRFRPDRNDNV